MDQALSLVLPSVAVFFFIVCLVVSIRAVQQGRMSAVTLLLWLVMSGLVIVVATTSQ